jgi:uncharacterized protein (TIRG00374 family)
MERAAAPIVHPGTAAPGEPATRSTTWRWWALALVALAVLAWIARHAQWSLVARAMARADVTMLIVATIVNLASLFAKGMSWWVFLRPLRATSLPLALRATVTGAAINNLLPAHVGEAARVLQVARAARVSTANVFSAFALERTMEGIGLALVLAVGVLAFGLPMGDAALRWITGFTLVLALLITVVLTRRVRRAADHAPPRSRVAAYLSRFLDGIVTAASGRRFIVTLVLVSASWSMQIATYHLTARAVGLPVTMAQTLALLLAANIGTLLRATPGSVGVFQLAYVLTAVALGLPQDTSVAAAILLQALQIIPVLILGGSFAIREGRLAARLAPLRASDVREPQAALPVMQSRWRRR